MPAVADVYHFGKVQIHSCGDKPEGLEDGLRHPRFFQADKIRNQVFNTERAEGSPAELKTDYW